MCGGSLQWRHNGHDGVSNHQPHDCLINLLFRCRSKKKSKHRVTGLCAVNSSEFPAQRTINAENVPIWWRHHVLSKSYGDKLRAMPHILSQTIHNLNNIHELGQRSFASLKIKSSGHIFLLRAGCWLLNSKFVLPGDKLFVSKWNLHSQKPITNVMQTNL